MPENEATPFEELTDPYDVMGVLPTATAAEIRKAYKRRILQYHPDRNLKNQEEAAIHFQKVEKAYKVVGNPVARGDFERANAWELHAARQAKKEQEEQEQEAERRQEEANRKHKEAKAERKEAMKRHEEARKEHEAARAQELEKLEGQERQRAAAALPVPAGTAGALFCEECEKNFVCAFACQACGGMTYCVECDSQYHSAEDTRGHQRTSVGTWPSAEPVSVNAGKRKLDDNHESKGDTKKVKKEKKKKDKKKKKVYSSSVSTHL